MKNKLYIACLLLAFFVSACATKKISTAPSGTTATLNRSEKKQLLQQLTEHQFQYATYQGRAKTRVAIGNQSFNATASVRIKHGEAIWMSFTSLLSIEVARVLITPSTIQIINRLQGTYIEKPFDYVYRFTGSQMSFAALEKILTGNTLEFAFQPENAFYKTGNGYQIKGAEGTISFDMLFSQEAALTYNQIAETSKNQQLTAHYKDFAEIESNNLPKSIQLQIKTPKEALGADMQYDTITLNTEVSMPFSVPDHYKRI